MSTRQHPQQSVSTAAANLSPARRGSGMLLTRRHRGAHRPGAPATTAHLDRRAVHVRTAMERMSSKFDVEVARVADVERNCVAGRA
jgi:hypothetical protein